MKGLEGEPKPGILPEDKEVEEKDVFEKAVEDKGKTGEDFEDWKKEKEEGWKKAHSEEKGKE